MPLTLFCNYCGQPSASDAQFCQRCGASFRMQPVAQPLQFVHYAGFWIRVVASLIDTILLLSVLLPTRWMFGSAITLLGLGGELPVQKILVLRRAARLAIGIAIGWTYKAGMESSRYQGTLGKMALHLQVTDLDGVRISLARATTRYFAKYLSTLLLGMGFLMVAFTEEKQGLHDEIAETRVRYRQR